MKFAKIIRVSGEKKNRLNGLLELGWASRVLRRNTFPRGEYAIQRSAPPLTGRWAGAGAGVTRGPIGGGHAGGQGSTDGVLGVFSSRGLRLRNAMAGTRSSVARSTPAIGSSTEEADAMDRFALVCRARKGSSRTRGGLVAAAIAAVPRDPLRPNWALESSSSSSERTSGRRGTGRGHARSLGSRGDRKSVV